MKTIVLLILGHLAGIALLFFIGTSLNATINQYASDYAGLITVFSTAFGLYSFCLNLLYHKNRAFHLWVNRLRLLFIHTHTYWQPAFDFDLPDEATIDRAAIMNRIIESLVSSKIGEIRQRATTPTSTTVSIDELMCFVFRLDNSHLHASLDRKLLVPSHLYDIYRTKLARIVEVLQTVLHPVSSRFGITVSFGDGVPNPYYGFFVNRLPSDLLQHFEVGFRLDKDSSCRIEAGTDHVNIEGRSLVDLFEALSQVLSLRALPKVTQR